MIGTERILLYPVSLILSIHKKTAEGIAKTLNISGDTFLRILKDECISWKELLDKALYHFETNPINLIIDDSIIKKHTQTT